MPQPSGYEHRLVLDEDVPEELVSGLQARGFRAAHVNDLRERILGRRSRPSDDYSIADDEAMERNRPDEYLRGYLPQ